jgi:hypothetical protein
MHKSAIPAQRASRSCAVDPWRFGCSAIRRPRADVDHAVGAAGDADDCAGGA